MATRDYITVNPWNRKASLPRLSRPGPELNGKIVQENGYTKFQWCPSDDSIDGVSSDELFYTVNKQYFRAEQFNKINKRPVLMSLGDSFTFGIGVRDAETWPSIVADKLDMVNWNMGSGGASNQDMYLIFQQMINNRYIPDIVCIMWSFKNRHIVSRNIISPIVEEKLLPVDVNDGITTIAEKDVTAYNNSINNDIESGQYQIDINDKITTIYEGISSDSTLEKSDAITSIYTDKDYLDFYIIRSAIISICKARHIKVKETFLDHELQKFAISHIVPAEGWSTGKFPMNPLWIQSDTARDAEHFGPKTLQSIADYYLESLPSTPIEVAFTAKPPFKSN